MKSALSILTLLLVTTTFMAAVMWFHSRPHTITLTDATYADKLKEQPDTLWFIKFYAPWCTYSHNMAPAWDQLGKALEGVAGIEVGSVDCMTSRATCSKAHINSYPSLRVFQNGEEVNEYRGRGRDLESLMVFVLQLHADQASAKAAKKRSKVEDTIPVFRTV